MKALIIAAGQGQRLRRWDGDTPKPLYKVAGLPLIERAILSSKKAGIFEFVVVIGYRGDEIKKHLQRRESKLGVKIQFVENLEWNKSNGHSVLKAKEVLKEPFVLMMSDHIFDWNILTRLTAQPLGSKEIILAVDERVTEIFDLPDATKVQMQSGKIQEIGKEIAQYNAIDTGLFYCSTGIFEALEIACREGQGSLTEAIRWLAARNQARTFSIGTSYWQDVDTPPTVKEAHRILFKSVCKDTDGFISRNLNRRVSGFLSRILVRLPIGPNPITWSALMVGLLSSFLVSDGLYWHTVLGGILFQFASIYDGCDGEVAKLKFASSRFGEWLDTACDNITYITFLFGVIVGLQRQGSSVAIPLGILSLFGVLLSLTIMYFYLSKFTQSGSLVTIQKELKREMSRSDANFFIKILNKVQFVMKRDFFALAFMTLCIFNQLELILVLTAMGANLTWIVIITTKLQSHAVSSEARHQ